MANTTIQYSTQKECLAKCKERRFSRAETFRTCKRLETLTGEPNPIAKANDEAKATVTALFNRLRSEGILDPSEEADFCFAFNNKTGKLKAKAPSRRTRPLAHAIYSGLMHRNNPFKITPFTILAIDAFGGERAKGVFWGLMEHRDLIPNDLDEDANCLRGIFPEDFM